MSGHRAQRHRSEAPSVRRNRQGKELSQLQTCLLAGVPASTLLANGFHLLHDSTGVGIALPLSRHGGRPNGRQLTQASTVNLSFSDVSTNGSADAPPVNVVCCCRNAPLQSSNNQYCCCGNAAECCQSDSFCSSRNCINIVILCMMAVVIAAGVLILWYYRARLTAHRPDTRLHGGGIPLSAITSGRIVLRMTPPAPVALPVRAPPPAEEGAPRECAVCLETYTRNADWAVFACGHATCHACHAKLVQRPAGACPLCRQPLVTPGPPPLAGGLQFVPAELHAEGRDDARAAGRATGRPPAAVGSLRGGRAESRAAPGAGVAEEGGGATGAAPVVVATPQTAGVSAATAAGPASGAEPAGEPPGSAGGSHAGAGSVAAEGVHALRAAPAGGRDPAGGAAPPSEAPAAGGDPGVGSALPAGARR